MEDRTGSFAGLTLLPLVCPHGYLASGSPQGTKADWRWWGHCLLRIDRIDTSVFFVTEGGSKHCVCVCVCVSELLSIGWGTGGGGESWLWSDISYQFRHCFLTKVLFMCLLEAGRSSVPRWLPSLLLDPTLEVRREEERGRVP